MSKKRKRGYRKFFTKPPKGHVWYASKRNQRHPRDTSNHADEPSLVDKSSVPEDAAISEAEPATHNQEQNDSCIRDYVMYDEASAVAEVDITAVGNSSTHKPDTQVQSTFVVAHMALIESPIKEVHHAQLSSKILGTESTAVAVNEGQEDSLQECQGSGVQVRDKVKDFTALRRSLFPQDHGCARKISPCGKIVDLSVIVEDTSEDVLLKEAQKLVCQLLPLHWFCSVSKDAVHVHYAPIADHLLAQRSVIAGLDGSVSIRVHDKSLVDSHELWGKTPSPVALYSETLNEFAEHVICIVSLVRRYDVCVGFSEYKYSQFLKRDKRLIFDQNQFQEKRYVTTYRSSACLKLVSLPAKQCKQCTYLKKQLNVKLKRFKTSPCPKTNNRYLNTPQKIKKFCFKKEGAGGHQRPGRRGLDLNFKAS